MKYRNEKPVPFTVKHSRWDIWIKSIKNVWSIAEENNTIKSIRFEIAVFEFLCEIQGELNNNF